MFKFDSETDKSILLHDVLGISKKQLSSLRSIITRRIIDAEV